MVAQLTEAINSQINSKAKSEALQDALPEDLRNEIDSDVEIESTEDVEKLQNRMSSAIGLMERILGEAVS